MSVPIELQKNLHISYVFYWEMANLQPKSTAMRILTTPELVEIMTTLYDNRLKALIGHEKTDFTREIIETMFQRFKEIIKETKNRDHEDYLERLSEIFSYMLEPDGPSVIEAQLAANYFVRMLENYQRYTLEKLLPYWDEEYEDVVFRNVFGLRFKAILDKSPDLYPQGIKHESMLQQLNYTTLYRNHESHKEVALNSINFKRYYILNCYDLFLTYLLYTFYYMALYENYTIKHIK